jgi:hypothetical protein
MNGAISRAIGLVERRMKRVLVDEGDLVDAEHLHDHVLDRRDVDAVPPEVVSTVDMVSVVHQDPKEAAAALRKRLRFVPAEPDELASVEEGRRFATRASALDHDRLFWAARSRHDSV